MTVFFLMPPPPFAAIILALKFNEPERGTLHKQT